VPLPGGRSVALGAALAASGCAFGSDRLLEPAACSKPVVSRGAVTANPTNVLSVFVRADVRYADSVMVRFGVDVALDSATPAFTANGDSVLTTVLGLNPATMYRAQMVAFNRCGTTVGELLPFATGALPSDLPVYAAGGPAPSPGYVVFAAGNYGLVIDNTGRVVWYHHFPNGPGLNFQPQPNGRYAARPSVAAGEVASWIEIAPEGTVTRTLGCERGLSPRMHDLIAQPDGSYWMLCDEIRTVDLSAQGKSTQARVLGTDVQRRSATGEVLFEWSPFDHLDIELSVLDSIDLAGPVINWTHGNALDLDGDGNLLVSFRNLSEVTKIDTRTGAVVWRIGGGRNEFTFENVNVPAFRRQHGVRAPGAGQLLLLDNLGETRGSRAERYELDEARHAARLSGSYASSAGLIAQLGGSTQALTDGRTLVSFGTGGAVEEYDAAGNMVWRLEGQPGYVFRAQRIRSLYRPGVGDPR
jgi:hypothetical protein